jgi:hypothetical protein
MMDDGLRGKAHRFVGLGWLRIVGLILVGVVGVAVLALAFGYFVKLLWNWLMPSIFGLGTINYWQAFGIVILAKLIFGGTGGFGRRGSSHESPPGSWRGKHQSWRRFWHEEGREAFRLYMDRRRSAEAESGGATPPKGSAEDSSEG